MAASVELRVPLLDHRLLELAFKLPADYKVRGAQLKRVLRHALRGVVPRPILERPKAGFPVPYRRWLRHELRDFVFDTVLSSDSFAATYFERPVVARLLEVPATGADGAKEAFGLLALELWHRQFVRCPQATRRWTPGNARRCRCFVTRHESLRLRLLRARSAAPDVLAATLGGIAAAAVRALHDTRSDVGRGRRKPHGVARRRRRWVAARVDPRRGPGRRTARRRPRDADVGCAAARHERLPRLRRLAVPKRPGLDRAWQLLPAAHLPAGPRGRAPSVQGAGSGHAAARAADAGRDDDRTEPVRGPRRRQSGAQTFEQATSEHRVRSHIRSWPVRSAPQRSASGSHCARALALTATRRSWPEPRSWRPQRRPGRS